MSWAECRFLSCSVLPVARACGAQLSHAWDTRKLEPGKHVIEIRNTTFAPYRDNIEVAADGVARIKHKFP